MDNVLVVVTGWREEPEARQELADMASGRGWDIEFVDETRFALRVAMAARHEAVFLVVQARMLLTGEEGADGFETLLMEQDLPQFLHQVGCRVRIVLVEASADETPELLFRSYGECVWLFMKESLFTQELQHFLAREVRRRIIANDRQP